MPGECLGVESVQNRSQRHYGIPERHLRQKPTGFVADLEPLVAEYAVRPDLLGQDRAGGSKCVSARSFKVGKLGPFRVFGQTVAATHMKEEAGHALRST